MSSVAILGCGPAGLMAAHAASLNGFEVRIYSEKVKSPMFGAMYLHKPIPGVSPLEAEILINVIKNGTRDGYAQNVYGRADYPCSWDLIKRGPTEAWNLKLAYDKLWDLYSDRITDAIIHPRALWDINYKHDYVFSTIPAKALCTDPRHEFNSQPIWVIHGIGEEFHTSLGSMMYYNGYTPSDGGYSWYRFSQINGYQAWEYSHEKTKLHAWKGQVVSVGQKPLFTTCDCNPEVIRIGRFGRWRKGVLTHHAFEDTEAILVRAREGL